LHLVGYILEFNLNSRGFCFILWIVYQSTDVNNIKVSGFILNLLPPLLAFLMIVSVYSKLLHLPFQSQFLPRLFALQLKCCNSLSILITALLRSSLHFSMDIFCKCTLVQVLSLCTGRTAHRVSRGIALLFHDKGTRSGWGVSVTPRPLFTPEKDRYPLYRRLSGPQGQFGQVRTISPATGTRYPDRPARSQSLYRLHYPAHNVDILITLYPAATFVVTFMSSSVCSHPWCYTSIITSTWLVAEDVRMRKVLSWVWVNWWLRSLGKCLCLPG
jgi:hypothetical protein